MSLISNLPVIFYMMRPRLLPDSASLWIIFGNVRFAECGRPCAVIKSSGVHEQVVQRQKKGVPKLYQTFLRCTFHEMDLVIKNPGCSSISCERPF